MQHKFHLLLGLRVLTLLVCVFMLTQARAAEPKSLRHNPFATPNMVALQSDRAQPENGEPLELRAVIVAGNPQLSMANINGNILRVGQQHNDITLVAVKAGSAVVTRSGTELTLLLDAEDAE